MADPIDVPISTISACLVVRNEEPLIARCLQSIQGVVDEVIVVHDGTCSDRTLEIASQYGARIFQRQYEGSSESHRCFSFEQASGGWILCIDADEFLSEALRQELGALAKATHVDAYWFSWPAYDGKRYITGPYSRGKKLALLRKNQMYFLGITHESPWTRGVEVERLDLMLEHRPGYDNYTWRRLVSKWFAWGRLQARQILNIDTADSFNIVDLRSTREYEFYSRWTNRPFRVFASLSVRLVWRQIRAVRGGGETWRAVTNFKSWKITSMHVANFLYLAMQIWRLRDTTGPANRCLPRAGFNASALSARRRIRP